MSIIEQHPTYRPSPRKRRDERDYAWMFWLAFPVFLLFAALSRLRPRRAGAAPSPRQSIFREAWVAANSSIPFAFMN